MSTPPPSSLLSSAPASGSTTDAAVAAVPSEQLRWFEEEVHGHDLALRSYLRGRFPSVRDVEDVVQESYLRIWRARLVRPITSTKAFLFQIARHLAIDGVRRHRTARTESLGDLAALPVLEEGPDACESLTRTEKIDFLVEALASLPARCREIMVLRKFQHLSHREIAVRLHISERTVESQVTRGMKLIEQRLRARGLDGFNADEP